MMLVQVSTRLVGCGVVIDCAGNETTHTQIITVEDTAAPTFNEALPADATVSCDNVTRCRDTLMRRYQCHR